MKQQNRFLSNSKIVLLISIIFFFGGNAFSQTAQTQPSIIDNMGYYLFSYHTSEDTFKLKQTDVNTFVNSGFNKIVVKGYYPYAPSINLWDEYMGNRIPILVDNNIHPVIAPSQKELRPEFVKRHLGDILKGGIFDSLKESVTTWFNKFGRDGISDILYDIEEPPSAMKYYDPDKDGKDNIENDDVKIFLSQTSIDDASPLGYTEAYDKLVQIFHPTGRYLGHVTLMAKIIGNPGPFTVSYWSVNPSTGRPDICRSAKVSVSPNNFGSPDPYANNYRSVTIYFHNDTLQTSLESESNRGSITSIPKDMTSDHPSIYLGDKIYAIVIDFNGSYSTSNYYSFAGTAYNKYNHPIDGINTCLYKYDKYDNWTCYSSCDLYFDFYGRMTNKDHEGKNMHTNRDWSWSNGYTYMPSDEWVAKKNSQINDIVKNLKKVVDDAYNGFVGSELTDKKLLTDINTIGNEKTQSNETDYWSLGYSDNYDKLMQTFRPKYTDLREVIFRMTKIGTPADIEVSIQELNSMGKPSGIKIATATITSDSVKTVYPNYTNKSVEFPGTALDTRKYYAIVLDYLGTTYTHENHYQFARPAVFYNLGYTAMCDAGVVNWRNYVNYDLAFRTKYLQAPKFIVYSGYGNANCYNHGGKSENEAFGIDWGTMKDIINVVNAGETELKNDDPPTKTMQVIGQLPLWTHLWNDSDTSKSKIDVTSDSIGFYIDKQLQQSFFPVGMSPRQTGGITYGTNITEIFTDPLEKDIFTKMAQKWASVIPNEKKYVDTCIFMSAVPSSIVYMNPWEEQTFSINYLPNDGRLKYYWSTNPATGPFSLSCNSDGSSNTATLFSSSPSVAKYGLTVKVNIVDGSYPTRTASNSFQVFIYGGSGGPNPTPALLDNSLAENYPNPFNPETKINYQIKEGGFVRLAIYDILGREVALLANGYQEAGTYYKSWNAASYASGIYIYNLTVKDGKGNLSFSQTKRMLLMK